MNVFFPHCSRLLRSCCSDSAKPKARESSVSALAADNHHLCHSQTKQCLLGSQIERWFVTQPTATFRHSNTEHLDNQFFRCLNYVTWFISCHMMSFPFPLVTTWHSFILLGFILHFVRQMWLLHCVVLTQDVLFTKICSFFTSVWQPTIMASASLSPQAIEFPESLSWQEELTE